MSFIQPFTNSAEQCLSYVSGTLTYANNPSPLGRAWFWISHPQANCSDLAARSFLVGLGIFCGDFAMSELAAGLNPHNSCTYRAFSLINVAGAIPASLFMVTAGLAFDAHA